MSIRLRDVLVVLVVAVGCGGGKKTAAPAPGTAAPVAACGAVSYSCTLPGFGCVEGGADLEKAMGAECASGGGTAAHTACSHAGSLGGCTGSSGLVPNQTWCGTWWMIADGKQLQTPADAQAKCASFGAFVPAT